MHYSNATALGGIGHGSPDNADGTMGTAQQTPSELLKTQENGALLAAQ